MTEPRWYDGSLFEQQNVLAAAVPSSSLRLQAFAVSSITNTVNLAKPGANGAYISKATPGDVQSDDYYIAASKMMAANKLRPSAHEHTICLFGRTGKADGAQSVCLRVKFPISFVVEMPVTHERAEDVRMVMTALQEAVAKRREWINSRSNDRRKHLDPSLKLSYTVDRRSRAVTWVPDPADETKPRLFTIMKLSFKNDTDASDAKKILNAPLDLGSSGMIHVSTWETKNYYPAQLRFSIETGVDPGNWLVASNIRPTVWRTTSTDLEYEVDAGDLVPDTDDQAICPTTQGCVDIECINADRTERLKLKKSALDKFPNADNPSHKVIMIGASFFMADGRTIRYLLQLDHEESDERTGTNRYPAQESDEHTHRCERRVYQDQRVNAKTKEPIVVDMAYRVDFFSDEREMICALRDLIVYYDADTLTTFNGDKFDWPYLVGRMGYLEKNRLMAEERGDYSDDVRVGRFNQLGRFVFDRWLRGRTKDGEYIPIADLALEKGVIMTPHLPGRIGLDLRSLMISLQANPKYKFASTTLDNVSARFLGDKKLEMGHNAIFDSWFGWLEGTATPDQQRRTLGDYCVKDVELPVRVIENQSFLMYLWQMGRITHTPPHNIINNGQMMRVTAQFCHEASRQGRFVNKNFIEPYKYQGACVLEPSVGFWGGVDLAEGPAEAEALAKPAGLQVYLDKLSPEEIMEYQSEDVVITLDYKSLYPSIMRSHVFCPSNLYSPDRKLSPAEQFAADYQRTLDRRNQRAQTADTVPESLFYQERYPPAAADTPDNPLKRKASEEEAEDDDAGEAVLYRPDDLSGVVVDADDRDDYTTVRVDDLKNNTTRYHKFTKHNQGIYPVLLKRLMDERVVYKDKIKDEIKKGAECDWSLVSIYDGRQLALKVSANSAYGVSGAKQDTPCACLPLAESVTAVGRQMIGRTKHESEVTFSKYRTRVIYGDSVTADTPIIVRRNRAEVDIVRIDDLFGSMPALLHHGDKEICNPVDTEVLDENGWTPLRAVVRHRTGKPIYRVVAHGGVVDVTEDHSLLRHDGSKTTATDVAVGDRLMVQPDMRTLFDGMSGPSNQPSPGLAWAMGLFVADGSCGTDGEGTWAINNANKNLLERAAAGLAFGTSIHVASSGVYTLVAQGIDIAAEWQTYFYNSSRQKVLPKWILAANIDTLRCFWDGLHAGEGISQEGKIGIAGLGFIANRLGYKTSYSVRADRPDVYRLDCMTDAQREDPAAVKTIYRLEEADNERTVYDLQTGSHHFHVGPGNLVVHNTDSVMVWMKQSSDVEAWRVAAEIADYVTDVVFADETNVNELEAEKITRGYSLFSKKCYIGSENEGVGKAYREGKKGISTVRMDKPGVLNNLQGQLTTVASKCYQMQRRTVAKLMVLMCIDHFEDMVAGRTPLKDYVISQRINKRTKETSHVFLANKLEAATGMSVARGDAIRYVHIHNPDEALASHRVETPDILITKDWNKMVDKEYYLSNKIYDQIKKTLRLYVPPECIEEIFSRYKRALAPGGQQSIDHFFNQGQSEEQIRREGIMRVFEGSCKRKRLPVRDNIPVPTTKRRKVVSKVEKQRQATTTRHRLDDLFKR